MISHARIATLGALFAAALWAAAPLGAQEFLEGLEDVPLMPGLETVTDSAMVFDTPAGRIVESYAAGAVDRAGVTGFYRETLPALGWTAPAPARFLREGEVLALDFYGVDGDLVVRFTLAPE